MKKTVLIGLNELNFEYIEYYIAQGRLPVFKEIFEKYAYKETTSESEYRLLEPWIQWVTLHTGKSYEKHRVFRLGDIVERSDLKQLWEIAEEAGHSVGAISPFNAANRLKNPCFFVPDPWTQTSADGDKFVQEVSKAVSQAVNDNADGGLTKKSIMSILKTYLKVVPFATYGEYLKMASGIKTTIGTKAVILDKLLGDLFIQQWEKYKPDFSSLFLNTGAHFQHHYMFNSLPYEGEFKNPDWYCPANQDPLFLILQEYDKFLGKLLKLDVRIIIATGLHQKPHKHLTFYWRLKDHRGFLEEIGIRSYENVIPRMSRDFLIEFSDEKDALESEKTLMSFRAQDDDNQIFNVDNRGSSLFVELTYPNEIKEGFGISGDKVIDDFKKYVAFVAIKNGEHDPIGYCLDTDKNTLPRRFPLADLHNHLVDSF